MTAYIDPQQEFFSRVKQDIEALGYSVHDGFMPPDGTPYPFVYLGDMRQADTETKRELYGTVYFTIHVWSNNPKKRGTLSGMLLNCKTVCRKITHTANYAWMIRNVNQQIFPDTTTKAPLLHGVIEVEAVFS